MVLCDNRLKTEAATSSYEPAVNRVHSTEIRGAATDFRGIPLALLSHRHNIEFLKAIQYIDLGLPPIHCSILARILQDKKTRRSVSLFCVGGS